MLAGYYTIASGMLTRQREIDVLGNNLVNAQTPGYRADRLIISPFEQELLTRREAGGNAVLGKGVAATSAIVGEEISLFNMGTVKNTDRDLDMTIAGQGFYNIQDENGRISLTRNGQFNVDEAGYLVLPNYGRVMGQSGPIQVGDANIQVEQNGEIYSDNGRFLGTLLITAPQEGTVLEKLNNGMFQFANGEQLPAAENYTVVQRSLELSNVDMNREMTYLIESQRAFQACSSALQIVDGLNRKAATQIGSTN